MEDGIVDAKLSTKKRKSLPESTFCGPGRSFPVPDCAHVRAAARLLNRAKASPATKAKIKSCINRKNTSMSCGVKMADEISPDTEADKLIDSGVFDETIDMILWMEDEFAALTPSEQSFVSAKQSAAKTLDKLRSRRQGVETNEDRQNAYLARSFDSILESITDELDQLDKTIS